MHAVYAAGVDAISVIQTVVDAVWLINFLCQVEPVDTEEYGNHYESEYEPQHECWQKKMGHDVVESLGYVFWRI